MRAGEVPGQGDQPLEPFGAAELDPQIAHGATPVALPACGIGGVAAEYDLRAVGDGVGRAVRQALGEAVRLDPVQPFLPVDGLALVAGLFRPTPTVSIIYQDAKFFT